jgi:hypothetical protein
MTLAFQGLILGRSGHARNTSFLSHRSINPLIFMCDASNKIRPLILGIN